MLAMSVTRLANVSILCPQACSCVSNTYGASNIHEGACMVLAACHLTPVLTLAIKLESNSLVLEQLTF